MDCFSITSYFSNPCDKSFQDYINITFMQKTTKKKQQKKHIFCVNVSKNHEGASLCKHIYIDAHIVTKYPAEFLYQNDDLPQWVPIHHLCSFVSMGTTDPYLLGYEAESLIYFEFKYNNGMKQEMGM